MNAVYKAIGTLIATALLLAPAAQATPAEAERIVAQLPREFSGQFKWRDEDTVQSVAFTFGERRIVGAQVEVTGAGTYVVPGRTTHIRVRAVIDVASLDIEIWELAPTTLVYVSEGTHRGRLSADLRTINAVWVTEPMKKTADLRLASRPR